MGVAYWLDNRHRRPEGPDFCLLQYSLRGSMTLAWNNRSWRVPEGHAALMLYGEDSAYGLRTDDQRPYEPRWVLLHGAGLGQHWRLLRERFGPVIGPDHHGRLLESMNELARYASAQSVSDLFDAAHHVHRFIGRLKRLCDGPSQSGGVDRAIDGMLANPLFPWSLKEIARAHACTREHLTRRFKQRIGSSPADWLNRQRLAVAKHLLVSSGLSMTAVAEQAGFASTHTMARQLKADSGCSPRAYRARAAPEGVAY